MPKLARRSRPRADADSCSSRPRGFRMASAGHNRLVDSPALQVVLSFLGIDDLTHLSHACSETHTPAFWELVTIVWPVGGPGRPAFSPGVDARSALGAYLAARRAAFQCPSSDIGGAWVPDSAYWRRGVPDGTALSRSVLRLLHVWWLDVCATHTLPPPLPGAASTPFIILLRVRSSSYSWQSAARSVTLEPLAPPALAGGGDAAVAGGDAVPQLPPDVAVTSATERVYRVPPHQWVWLYLGRAEVRGTGGGGAAAGRAAAALPPPRVTWRLRDTSATFKQGLDIDCSVAARPDALDSLAQQAGAPSAAAFLQTLEERGWAPCRPPAGSRGAAAAAAEATGGGGAASGAGGSHADAEEPDDEGDRGEEEEEGDDEEGEDSGGDEAGGVEAAGQCAVS